MTIFLHLDTIEQTQVSDLLEHILAVKVILGFLLVGFYATDEVNITLK
jgi:hypothetical protein